MTRRPRAARAGYPARVVCLTEETVETLYAIGAGSLVVGVSAYARRPAAIKHLPRVCAFIEAKLDRIDQLEPDLVLAFCDLQADIVRDLIRRGHTVHTSNMRSIEDIYDNIRQVGALVGYASEAETYARKLKAGVEAIRRKTSRIRHKPKVYFEEWDDPMITGIAWVGELIDIAGGRDIFPELRGGVTAHSHKVD
ncbi:MAG: ABC transporter substrate-binding protein, partial [Planctomycetota bacterium]